MSSLTRLHLLSLMCTSLVTPNLWAQAIQSQGAAAAPGEQEFHLAAVLPETALSVAPIDAVSLRPGLFQQRREATKAYLERLQTNNVLQNHRLEAGFRDDRSSEQLHQGWEAPHYQLRGHFAGHWLSAASRFAAMDHDALLSARSHEAVNILHQCQDRNGDGWVGSVPEKYFGMLEKGQPVWSPQYTLHKTLMGLFDAYRYDRDQEAMDVLAGASDWFDRWTAHMIEIGRGEVVYGGECAGLLELWADLYGETQDPKYLRLASRYAMPDLFPALLAGQDALSNDHANASIPWIHGAARLYEVTGDTRYRDIVLAFWKSAVTDRGMFATTGNNAGEFWIPPHQFGRFLGRRTQEHCTVYNMIRVADTLLRWTGEATYADYIERALYNGILAQQHPHTGLVSYFLPLAPGARKEWGSDTNDFWCCHGTLLQAQANHEHLIFYQANDGITVAQFIPAEANFGSTEQPIRLVQQVDDSAGRSNFTRADGTTQLVVNLQVESAATTPWTLRVRQPVWAIGPGQVTIDGKPSDITPTAAGFLEIHRHWKKELVTVTFTKRVTVEPLPGDSHRFALLDGPVVLAAITDHEPRLDVEPQLTPMFEHVYEAGRDWQTGHYLASTDAGSIVLKPLYEVIDEAYSVYFSTPQ